jgi:transposase
MTSSGPELPQELDACHAWIGRLQETGRQQSETIAQQQETIDRLLVDLALLKRSLFGSRRERFVEDPRQGRLFETASLPARDACAAPPQESPAEASPPMAPSPPRRTSSGRGRRIFPEFLPRKTLQHALREEDIPEALRNDPQARRFFKKTSEELEFEPAALYVIEHYQEVIARDEATEETILITAPKPSRLIDAYTGPGFWAHLTASRFADHLPYYRQEDILSRHGFRIGRSTLWRWMAGLAEGVRPLVERMRQLALQSLVLGVDETPVTMLGGESNGSVKSYLWGTVGDEAHPYDCFYFTSDRSRAGPDQFLSGYQGYLQSDSYICYELISEASAAILKVGCWAHARRKFEELHVTAPSVATHTALGFFQRLYEIEGRGRLLTETARYELRQREARPIVKSFQAWLAEQYERELPKSKLRSAIGYMIHRWEVFERYLECGAIPIDNNRTEAALKYAVLGRKAWLFFGNALGGETASILFTLTKSCNRHRVDPFAYLRDVYTRLPTVPTSAPHSIAACSALDALLPDRWVQAHPEHLIQERVAEAQQRAQRKQARRAQRRLLAQ